MINELPQQAHAGIRKHLLLRTDPQGVTPECFNRGSTMLTTTLSEVEWVGGPVPVSPGFPIDAFGNDKL